MAMPALWDWKRAATLTFLALPLGLRAERNFHTMQRLPHVVREAALPSLSIIVPARNEAHNLPALLDSLCNLCYPGDVEIVVVDDGSTDDTPCIAERYGARVLRLDGPPPGWLGKPHACHRGAEIARGEWLLFTDADMSHAVDGPRLAVSHAIEQRLDALSLFVHQEYRSGLERLALSVAFAGLFAGRRPDNYVLNGQYILIRRAVYHESGGFAGVRGEPLEDLALGNLLHRRGFRIAVLLADHAATVHMYDDFRHVWNGMTRLGAGSLQWSGLSSLVTALFISAVMSPLIVLTGVATGRLRLRWLPVTWFTAALGMFTWANRTGSAVDALLAPIGALLVQVAAVWGLARRVLRLGVPWKGRRV